MIKVAAWACSIVIGYCLWVLLVLAVLRCAGCGISP
jgi:hypothetical protein